MTLVIYTAKKRTLQEVITQKRKEVCRVVNRIIPPKQAPEINHRVQLAVDFHLRQGDVAGAQRALDEARAQMELARRKL